MPIRWAALVPMTVDEMVGLALVAFAFALSACFARLGWLARSEPSRRAGFGVLAAVALMSPPILHFLFVFRDGLGPDAELSTGAEALSRWIGDAWPIIVLTALFVAVGTYLVRRAA